MNRILYEVSFVGNIQRWLVMIFGISILVVGGVIQKRNGKIKEEERIAITIVMIAVIAVNAIGVVVGWMGTLIPYKNGQHLRIRYLPKSSENTIVYIEQMMPEEWETD